MGIWDTFSDIVEAVTPWSVVEAEAPAEEPKVWSSLVAGNKLQALLAQLRCLLSFAMALETLLTDMTGRARRREIGRAHV